MRGGKGGHCAGLEIGGGRGPIVATSRGRGGKTVAIAVGIIIRCFGEPGGGGGAKNSDILEGNIVISIATSTPPPLLPKYTLEYMYQTRYGLSSMPPENNVKK